MNDEIEWTPVKVKLGDLSHWPENPVTLTKAQAKKLLRSKEKLGAMQTLAIGPNNGDDKHPLYDGHQRANVWGAAFGMDTEVWALQSSRLLTDDERHAVPIMLRTAVGSLDWDTLAGWTDFPVGEWGLDADMLQGLKFDIAALGNMLESETPEPADAEPQIDRAEELNEKWQVKTGDLWRIGEHRLLCGDSTRSEDVERVMQGERAQITFTSPPYNAGVSAQLSGNTHLTDSLYVDDNDKKNIVDYIAFLVGFSHIALSVSDYLFVNIQTLAGNKTALIEYWYALKDVFCDVAIWDKIHAAPLLARRVMNSQFEFLLIFSNQNQSRAVGTRDWRGTVANVYQGEPQRCNELSEIHGATMPVHFPLWVIGNFTNNTEFVLEPFAGTGTTIVACQNLDRKCRAIEISPAYCAATLERMATAFPGIEIERIDNNAAMIDTE